MTTGTGVSRVVHALLALVVATGLVIQLVLIATGGADANSGDTGATLTVGTRLIQLFSYFTIQSNVIVGVVAALLARDPLRDGRGFRVARLDALLGIIITGIVFDVVLAPLVHLTGWALVATILFHYVAPWLTVVAWLVLGPRRRWSWWTVLLAFVWPLAWLGYTFVRGAVVGWYPYPFLDAGRLGLGQALLNSLVVVVLGAVLALVLTAVDRRLPAVIRTG